MRALGHRFALLRQDESGVIAVVTALLAVVLLICAAFAVDIGRWYVEGQRLQRTVDAASLAGSPYLPGNLTTAREEARKVIALNGYDSSTAAVPDSAITIGDRPSRLKVTMTSQLPNAFATVIGLRNKTLTRTATADFAAAVSMGSPCNVLGNEPPAGTSPAKVASANCSVTPNFWQNIAGPDSPKANGDRYGTRGCVSGDSNCDQNKNEDYWGGPTVLGQPYYVYKITARSPVASMSVQIFDPMFVDVGDHCELLRKLKTVWPGGPTPNASDAGQRYAGGDSTTGSTGTFCTGDNLFNRPNPVSESAEATNAAKLNTSFLLLNPTDTLNPLEATAVCAPTTFGGFSGDLTRALESTDLGYNPKVASNFRQWVGLCPINNPEVGRDYYLLVRTNVPPNPTAGRMLDPTEDRSAGGEGHNRFGLRVSASGGAGNSAVTISALERMPIYANLMSGTTDFHLARVASANAGALLTVTFFDSGDADGQASIAIKDPSGAAPADCEAKGEIAGAGYPRSLDFDEPTCTLNNVQNSLGYDGKVQVIEVRVPDTYSCDDLDPNACWYRLKFTYPTGVSATDTTTWSASLDGDPVRLVK